MKYENLRQHILTTSRCNPGGRVDYHLSNLAAQFGLPRLHVEQILIDMKDERLINVSFDNGFGVVTLTARGGMLLELLPKKPIGFNQGLRA
jgi:hypothetical protein